MPGSGEGRLRIGDNVARSASQAIAIDSLLGDRRCLRCVAARIRHPSVMIDAGSEMARDDCARHDLLTMCRIGTEMFEAGSG